MTNESPKTAPRSGPQVARTVLLLLITMLLLGCDPPVVQPQPQRSVCVPTCEENGRRGGVVIASYPDSLFCRCEGKGFAVFQLDHPTLSPDGGVVEARP